MACRCDRFGRKYNRSSALLLLRKPALAQYGLHRSPLQHLLLSLALIFGLCCICSVPRDHSEVTRHPIETFVRGRVKIPVVDHLLIKLLRALETLLGFPARLFEDHDCPRPALDSDIPGTELKASYRLSKAIANLVRLYLKCHKGIGNSVHGRRSSIAS